jgi:non-heme chloroperoxidase
MAGARTAVALAAGAVAAGAAAARTVDARWAATEAVIHREDRLLPVGESPKVVTDDGAELAVTVAGSGPTVVLAHGWTNGREVWAPVAHRLLRGGHRVVLYDQRGHGSSTTGDDGFTIERLGGDLRAVLDTVDARDAVLAGHSMGGMTIKSLVSHHPATVDDRVSAVVLVATAASGLSRGRADAMASRQVASPVVERLMRSPIGHALVRGTVGRTVRRDDLVLTRDLFVGCAPDVRSGWLSAMQAMDLRDGIRQLRLPTTVLVGDRDRLTPPGRAAELVDVIRSARLQTFEGAGHMLPLERPDDVADAIAAATAEARSAA